MSWFTRTINRTFGSPKRIGVHSRRLYRKHMAVMKYERELQGPNAGKLLLDEKYLEKLRTLIRDDEELLMKARQDLNKGYQVLTEMTTRMKEDIPYDPEIDRYTTHLLATIHKNQQELTGFARDLSRRDQARNRDRARNFIGAANSEKRDDVLARRGGKYLQMRFVQLEAAANKFFKDEIHGEAFNQLLGLLGSLPADLKKEGQLLIDLEFHLKSFIKRLSEHASGKAVKTLEAIRRDLETEERRDFKEARRAA